MDLRAHLATLQALFEEALTYPEGAERDAFLEHACGAGSELRAEVDQLLASDKHAWRNADWDSHLPRFGPYQAVRLIGRGGSGAVYLAERMDGEFRMRAAVKVIAGKLLNLLLQEQFRRERQILAGLNHPNITRLLDGGVEDGAPYLVMEFVEGGRRLDDYCREENLDTSARIELLCTVCRAVEYAHSVNVVHRDLKPSNILVTPDGTVKLLDFGSSKLMETSGVGTQTVTAIRGVTPEYASPEQIEGRSTGTSTDVYSLGVLIAKLCPNDPGAMRVSEKARQRDPSQRHASVAELRNALRDRNNIGYFLWSKWGAALAVLLFAAASAALPLLTRNGIERPAASAMAKGEAPDPKAVTNLNLGKYHFARRTPDAMLKSIVHFREATRTSPKSAEAHGWLANSLAMLPEYFDENVDQLSEARLEAQLSVRLDPKVPVAHVALAWVLLVQDHNWPGAEAEFKKGVELAPEEPLPHQRYGLALISRRRFDEAERELRKAQSLAPLEIAPMINLAELWFYSRRYDLEREELKKILERDPGHVVARTMLAGAELMTGNRAQAIDGLKFLVSLPEGRRWCQSLGLMYAQAGQPQAALSQMQSCGSNPPLPLIYAYLGDLQRCIDLLEEQRASRRGYFLYFALDPSYDPFRSDPRFQAFAQKVQY